jgi:hypothetical protein
MPACRQAGSVVNDISYLTEFDPPPLLLILLVVEISV